MPVFSVPEMHCDACIRALTAAVTALDPNATMRANLASKQLEVQARASAAAVADAIRNAGFDVDVMSA